MFTIEEIKNKLEGKNVTLLFSPGIDSYITHFLLSSFYTGMESYKRIYFSSNIKYTENELLKLKKGDKIDFSKEEFFFPTICNDKSIKYDSVTIDMTYRLSSIDGYLTIDSRLDLNDLEDSSAFIPNRNLLYCSMAHSRIGSDVILLSGFKDDVSFDMKPEFFNMASNLLSKSYQSVEVMSLFSEYSRKEILDFCMKNGMDPYKLESETYSCYNNKEALDKPLYIVDSQNNIGRIFVQEITKKDNHCRLCEACFRRFCTLINYNIFIPFGDNKILIKYFEDYIKDDICKDMFDSIMKYVNMNSFYINNKDKIDNGEC